MKILFANDALNRGGAETLIYDTFTYAQAHRDSRLESLDLLIGDGHAGYAPQLAASYGNVFVVKRRNVFDPRFLMRIRRLLKDKKFDIIHSHSTTLAIHLWLAKFGLRIKLVQTIHGFWDSRCPNGKFNLKRYLTTIAMTYLADATLCVSSYVKSEASRSPLCARRMHVVWNGVNFERTQTGCSPQKSLKDEGCNQVTFGMVGNFNHVRDHKCVLDAFRILKSEYPNCRLLLAGSGSLLHVMKEYAASIGVDQSVEFMGIVRDVGQLFSSLDCYLYSSRSDTFGISVVEAMGFGLPVIVSDNGPFPELTEGGKYAHLFRAQHPSDLANRMREYVINAEAHKAQATENSKYLREKFSIACHVRALAAVYAEVLSQPEGRG